MSLAPTSEASFFEQKYKLKDDPWDFATSAYELGRYEATVRALGTRRYRHAYEPGCSVGVLTAKLAQHCDQVEAIDFSDTAVKQAKKRCGALENVTISCGSILKYKPQDSYDLLVLSEIGYYFDVAQWIQLTDVLLSGLQQDGTLLAVHWLGSSSDHQISGDEVHSILCKKDFLRLTHSERCERFRLDRWNRE